MMTDFRMSYPFKCCLDVLWYDVPETDWLEYWHKPLKRVVELITKALVVQSRETAFQRSE